MSAAVFHYMVQTLSYSFSVNKKDEEIRNFNDIRLVKCSLLLYHFENIIHNRRENNRCYQKSLIS